MRRILGSRIVGSSVIVVAAALSLSACVNSQGPSTLPSGAAPTFPAPNPVISTSAGSAGQTAPVAGGKDCVADDVKVVGQPQKEPAVTIPDSCQKPSALVTKDLVAGTGPEADAGSTVQVNYVVVTWSDKKEVDSSFVGGVAKPITVADLGQAQVIDGWNEGLVGMKQGGRRLLIVPPAKGYGPAGNGSVKPDETLVFVVDAVKVG
jgi:peptidylprolyl isomerase